MRHLKAVAFACLWRGSQQVREAPELESFPYFQNTCKDNGTTWLRRFLQDANSEGEPRTTTGWGRIWLTRIDISRRPAFIYKLDTSLAEAAEMLGRPSLIMTSPGIPVRSYVLGPGWLASLHQSFRLQRRQQLTQTRSTYHKVLSGVSVIPMDLILLKFKHINYAISPWKWFGVAVPNLVSSSYRAREINTTFKEASKYHSVTRRTL